MTKKLAPSIVAEQAKRAEIAKRKQAREDATRSSAYASIRRLSSWPNDEDESYAHSVLSASYERGITKSAEDYVKRLQAGEYDDAESFDEQLREDVDGDADVIWTSRARTVGYVSRFDWQQEWDDMGSDKSATVEQIAFLCILGETREEIERQLECSLYEFFENGEHRGSDVDA